MKAKESSTKNDIENSASYLHIAWYLSIAILLGMMIFLPIMGSFYYFLDLFTHFQGQYLVVMFFLLLIGLLIRIKKVGLLIISIVVIVHFIVLIYPVQIIPFQISSENDFDVYYLNSLYYNRDTESIEEQVEVINPELVVFVEANDKLIENISQIYGPPAVREGDGGLTCVIFTNGEYQDYKIDQNDFTYPVCTILKERTVILAIHPYPPLSADHLKEQDLHFQEVSNLIDQIQLEGYDFILLGDFNSTFYTKQFRKYFAQYHKKNVYSWETDRFWSIPIDHALSNKQIEIFSAPKSSSDHSAIMVDYK